MNIAIVFFRGIDTEKIIQLSHSLSRGLESQGHIVNIIDGDKESDKRLSSYKYIVIGASSSTFFGGKLDSKIAKFLANAGMVQGKRSSAFIFKKGLRCEKTLLQLMKIMETEGMYLKNSDIIQSEAAAEYFGKKLHVE
ncbi:MAG: hypothetical protein JW874_00255 [Spirochaetales bacterium]|nr:hypothetical protein [Spirochaetales bacterium]